MSQLNSQQQPNTSPVDYVRSLSDYSQLVTQLSYRSLLVLNFTASWCGPCRRISPHFEQLQQQYPDVCFRKVDVDDTPDVSEYFQVAAMPTFVFLRAGNPIDRLEGGDVSRLIELIERHCVPPYHG